MRAGAPRRARAGLSDRSAVGPRPAVRVDDGGVLDDGQHLEPVRALHRHVHHLQLVRDCRHPAAIGNRDPARARRDARADPVALSRRERGHRPHRIDWRAGVRPADRARHRGVDRLAHQRRLRRRAAGRRDRDQSAVSRTRARHRHRHEHDRGADSRAERGARRSGAGAAEGEISGAVGGREPRARRRRRRARRGVARLPRRPVARGLLRRLHARHRRCAAAQSSAVARAREGDSAGSALAASGGRRARRGQPDPGSAPDVGERGGADALAGARRRLRGDGARQLRLDHRLDGDGAQPGPVRRAVAGHRGQVDAVPAVDGAGALGDPWRGARPDGARRAGRLSRHTGDDRRRRSAEPRRDGAAAERSPATRTRCTASRRPDAG